MSEAKLYCLFNASSFSVTFCMYDDGRYHERGVTGICITSTPGWDFIGKAVILIPNILRDTYENLV